MKQETIYDVNFFIKKFEAIPENRWCVNEQVNNYGQRCAYGHCLYNSLLEADEFGSFDRKYNNLLTLTWVGGDKFQQISKLADINNGYYMEYQQSTPKQRILAALYDIKAIQQKDTDVGKTQIPEPKTKTVYVSVPTTVISQAKELVTNNN